SDVVALGDPATWHVAGVELGSTNVALVEVDEVLRPVSFSALTPAEQHIAARVLAGATNEEIARERGTSVYTVSNQIQSIYCKLRVESRAELVNLCRSAPPSLAPTN